MSLKPKKSKKAKSKPKDKKQKKTKWDTPRGPVFSVEPPADVEMHNGKPVSYATESESKKMLADMEKARWERIENKRKEREELEKRKIEHEKRMKILIPKLEKMTFKQLQDYVKKNGPIQIEFDEGYGTRGDKYRTPENIIAGRKMGYGVENTGWYFEKMDDINESKSSEREIHKFHERVRNMISPEERREANDAVGSVSIAANLESNNPECRGVYHSVDYLNEAELKKLTPIRINWSRDWVLMDAERYDKRDGKPYLVVMSPDEFLAYSHTLVGKPSEMSIRTIKTGVKDDNIFHIPRIYRGANGVATGEHEGRHRALAFKEMGIDAMPVVIWDESQRGGPLHEWSGRDKVIRAYEDFHP